MPKVTPLLNAFNAGEWSPKLKGRSDLEKYSKACETMENFYPFRHGGASRRPGSYYIGAVKTAGKKTRLIPFEFSTTQAYVLEFSDQYIRIIKDHGLVATEDSYTKLLLHGDGQDAATSFTDDGNTGHTITTHGNAQVDTDIAPVFGTGSILFDGTGDYVSAPNHADWNFSTGAFTIDFWVKVDALSSTHGLFSQYDDDDNKIACYLAINNILWFRINSTTEIVALGADISSVMTANTWHHIAIVRGWGGNANDWALCVDGAAVDTDTQSGTAPDLDGTFNIGFDDFSDYYLTGWIDEFRVSKGVARWTADFSPCDIAYPHVNTGGGGTIYTVATPYVEADLPYLKFAQSADTMWIVHPSHQPRKLTRSAHDNWTLSAYEPTANPFTSGNYPSCVAFFEERIFFAATNSYPQRVYASKSGDWEDMTTGSNDADAFVFTLAADQVNVIRWLAPRQYLNLGTIGGEWRVWSGSQNEPMTPSNVKATRDATFGSADFQPITLGSVTLFLQRMKRKIRELVYSFEEDAWKAPDLTLLAEHITDGGIVSALAFQPEPHSILYAVRNDGTLLGMTYDREQDVVAWFRWVAAEGGEYESIAVIPGLDDEYELYATVKRTVDGSTVRYIEYFLPFDQGTDKADHKHLDSMISYEGGAASSISGLSHLEGESVYINADGTFKGPYTVSSGAISISPAASTVHIGLLPDGILQTMPADFGSAIGTALGKRKHISKYWIRYLNTKEFYYGPDASNLTLLTNSDLGDDAEEVTPLGGWEEDAQVYIKTYGPFNCTILAVVPDLVTND